MNKQKNRQIHFVIPKSIEEVKKELASFREAKGSFVKGTSRTNIAFKQSQENVNKWHITIKQPVQKTVVINGRNLETMFVGSITYQTLTSTQFDGKITIDHLYKRYIFRNLPIPLFFAFIALESVHFILYALQINDSPVLGFLLLVLLSPLIIVSAIKLTQSDIQKSYDNMLSIIRDLAPDDVII